MLRSVSASRSGSVHQKAVVALRRKDNAGDEEAHDGGRRLEICKFGSTLAELDVGVQHLEEASNVIAMVFVCVCVST